MTLPQPKLNPTTLLEKFNKLEERYGEDDAILAMLSWLYLAEQYDAHGGEQTRKMIEDKLIKHQMNNFRKRKRGEEEKSTEELNKKVRLVFRRAKLLSDMSDIAMMGAV